MSPGAAGPGPGNASTAVEAERRYRELFDRVPVGVWEEDLSQAKAVVDRLRAAGVRDFSAHFRAHPEDLVACAQAVRVLDVNAEACAMVGARDKQELLANLHKVFIPEALEDFGYLVARLAEGAPVAVSDGWNGTLSGDRRWVAVRAVPTDGHADDWGRVLVTTSDVTERRAAHEERAQLQERLRHAQKLEAVGRLAGGVAHDFNNILAAILGFAELSLEETIPGTPLHEAQQHVKEAALRARELVRQILTFGQRDRPELRPVDLPAVVREALALARAGVPASVEFEVRIDPAAGVVLADRTQLHQVVLNLCANARDAVGARGRIEVAVDAVAGRGPPELPPGPHARLRVRDDGEGMDELTRSRLFEPYMTTKGRTGGHGLGLAVVHGIVAAAGGVIQVESALGRGSTFDVYLPRLAAAPVEAPPLTLQPPRGAERVLLVDDEPLVRTAHRRLLQSLGYQVTEARDGLEALERLRAGPADFDLVLTDQAMPRLDGAGLARAIRQELPGTRIILCTGYSDGVDEDGARALGVQALLGKPIERAALAVALRRVLDAASPGRA
ncbi:MAG: response regulator [Anaeromyxobacteraceae bacterium]|nr:response regulator [Anaeromyxobacteraceae bacterium]